MNLLDFNVIFDHMSADEINNTNNNMPFDISDPRVLQLVSLFLKKATLKRSTK